MSCTALGTLLNPTCFYQDLFSVSPGLEEAQPPLTACPCFSLPFIFNWQPNPILCWNKQAGWPVLYPTQEAVGGHLKVRSYFPLTLGKAPAIPRGYMHLRR